MLIRETLPEDAKAVSVLIDAVARERRYLAATVGFSEESTAAFIDEKHLTETGGKTFLTLTAIGWEKDRLRFRLEAGFSEIEDRYLFDGLLDPAELKVRDWKVSKATASTRQ